MGCVKKAWKNSQGNKQEIRKTQLISIKLNLAYDLKLLQEDKFHIKLWFFFCILKHKWH